MSWLTNLIREDLRDMAPYSSARTEAGGFTPSIAIDANEFPWPPFGPIASKCEANRYPEPQSEVLLQKLAAVWGLRVDQILIGRGSDEGIDVLLRLFCKAGSDQILICPPTYGMYKVGARIQGAEVLTVPLKRSDWQLDVPEILSACTLRTKLIFIPSPNAPMGHMMRKADILEICKARSEKSLVVVDEAYVEFTQSPQGMLEEIETTPNLVVLRTLSKAHALAGERVGTVIGAPELIQNLLKILAPYPLTQSSIRSALETLSPNGIVQNLERRRLLVEERKRMAQLLLESPFITSVFPSVANFLLVQTTDSKAFMEHLKKFGISPRNRHSDIENTVRLSIGTPDENNLVLHSLGIKVDASKNLSPRLFSTHRGTKETSIDVTVNLDAPNFLNIDTGIGFFDHMLAQLASHGGFGLELHCQGDLIIDQHHSIEDCALALGETLKAALGEKRGIARFGFTAPLDEALAQVTVDLSGRPFCAFEGNLPASAIGELNSEMVPHFFHSLANALKATIHITVKGENTHHMVEASFKAMGRAFRQAFHREGLDLPSTKGVL